MDLEEVEASFEDKDARDGDKDGMIISLLRISANLRGKLASIKCNKKETNPGRITREDVPLLLQEGLQPLLGVLVVRANKIYIFNLVFNKVLEVLAELTQASSELAQNQC